ncbi:MAG: helix-turn-helix domain-containing protein [Candidatus Uhrbacteria bacterium]
MRKFSQSLLQTLGLTDNQAAVYLAALELGEANMQALARKSGVKRTSIYHFIDELRERGFITETTKRKRKVYGAVDPQQFLEAERVRLDEFRRIMPELLAINNRAAGKPRVAFYEGAEGIKSVFADMLRDGKEIIAYEDAEQRPATLGEEWVAHYPVERTRRRIPFKSILRDSPTARALVARNRELLRQSKIIPGGDWRTEINIYGNKVALFSFRAKTPFCVLIEDHDLAETLRTTWHELWNRLEGPVIG